MLISHGFASRLCCLQRNKINWHPHRKKSVPTSLASLRNKIRRHETSKAHKIAQELTEKGRQDLLGNLVSSMSETVFAETDAVFRTAYYLAKMNRTFTDHNNLIELQEKNGVNMGASLHSRYSSTKIVEHIAKEMQKKLFTVLCRLQVSCLFSLTRLHLLATNLL